MRPFIIEMRRSPMLWCAPVLLILDVLLIFGRPGEWIGVWPQTSARAQWPVLILGPALAAVSAWSAGRARRDQLLEQLNAAARPRWRVEWLKVVTILIYGVLVYLVGAVIAVSATAATGVDGIPWPSYLILGLAPLALSVALGHAVGAWSRSRVAPAVLAIGVFTALSWLQDTATWPMSFLSGHPQMRLDPFALSARLMLAAALLVAVAAGTVMASRVAVVGRGRSALIASAVIAIGAIAAIQAFGPLRVPREPPAEPMCSRSVPQVCVWPEEQKYLVEAAGIAQRIATVTKDEIPIPKVFNEEGLKGTGSQSGFWIGYGTNAMMMSMVRQILPLRWSCSTATIGRKREWIAALTQLRAWLVVRVTGDRGLLDKEPATVRSKIQNVLEGDPAAQASWAGTMYQSLVDPRCG